MYIGYEMTEAKSTPKKLYPRKEYSGEKCCLCNKIINNNYMLKIYSKSGK